MLKAIREAVNAAVEPLTQQITTLRREQMVGGYRARFQRRLAESGLPTAAQGVVLEDLMEAAAENLLPSEDAKLDALLERRVARMKSLTFAPSRGPKATGQGVPATEIAEADGEQEVAEGEGEEADTLATVLQQRLYNANKPRRANSGVQEAMTGVIAPTGQQMRVAEAAAGRTPRNALEEAWAADDNPRVALES